MKPINEHENLPFFEKWFFTDPYASRWQQWLIGIMLGLAIVSQVLIKMFPNWALWSM